MATIAWAGNGATTKSNLDNDDNWTGGVKPGANDTATFGTCTTQPASGTCNVGSGGVIALGSGCDILGGTFTAGSITMASAARVQGGTFNGTVTGAYGRLLGGTWNGNVTLTSAAISTLYHNLTINGNLTVTTTLAGDLGAYTLTVTGQFTYGSTPYTKTSNIVAAAYVIAGHDNYTGGAAGTYHEATTGEVKDGTAFGAGSALTGTYSPGGTYAEGQTAQHATDAAFLETNKAEIGINDTAILAEFGVTGEIDFPTPAAIATAVWQDSTAGDFTTASSIGKSLYTSGNVPGAAGGHFIAGTNAATTITTALTTTFTGNLTGSVASCASATLAASQHVIVDSGTVTTVSGNVNGSVGSVTGAVGSVTGAVGSVTGAVGSVTAGVTLAASQHVIVDSGTVTTVTNQLAAATIAGAVLDEAKGAHAGLLAGVALDSTVAKDATVSKPGTAQTITANQAVNVAQWGGTTVSGSMIETI